MACIHWIYFLRQGILSSFVLLTLLSLIAAQNEDGVIHFQVQEQVAFEVMGSVKNEPYVLGLYDASQRDQLRFSLTPNPSQDDSLFTIDSVTGVMATAVAIDREEYCPYQELCYLYIDVSATQPRFESFTVQIEVRDINDFMPYFDPLEVTLTFSEAAPVGTGRNLPLARDLDSPYNGVKWYEIMTSNSPFELEQTGSTGSNGALRLVLKETLDRERIESYTLRIGAHDSTDPLLGDHRGELTVIVNVEDDNDNYPVFENSAYTAHIAEDNIPISLIASVRAVDLDSGENGRVTYSFSPSSIASFEGTFSIDTTSGNVYLNQSLDYETQNIYNLEIVASDSGVEPRSSTISLNIYVIDKNDNEPEITINTFTEYTYARIPESALPETFVAHVRVSDADATGNNGKTSCSMEHPAFELVPFQNTLDQYKIFTSSTFDRELQPSFTLLIQCTDHGQSPLEASKTFLVEILDENDNGPRLSQAHYDVSIAEDNEVGVVILKLNATDADVGENARLTYTISSVEIAKYINLNEDTGEIRANVRFDYERLTYLAFEVHVRDNGVPQRSTSANVSIHILDINDESPAFTQSQFIFLFTEEQPPARFIGQVVAEDSDGEPYNRFTYSFVNPQIPFEINPDTGGIVSTQTFDRESQDVYVFDVKVTDTHYAAFYDTAQVIVDIKDINDNEPQFVFPNDQNSTVTISNQVPKGTAVFAVEARDADFDQNANVTYQLREVNSREQHFRISFLYGTVTTTADLSDVKYKEYDLQLTIKDNGSPALYVSRSVTVVVDSRVTYVGTTKEPKEEKSEDGGNATIIIAVSVVSGLLVLSLALAIGIIKLREWRKPKEERLDDTPYEAERKDLSGIDGPLSPNDTLSITSGRSSPLSSVDGSFHVSYTPAGQKGEQIEKPVVSPDNIHLYDKKMPQKTYLAQTGDHDTSSSTEDSGRGGSEEGGELTKLQRESQGATPEIIMDSRLPSAAHFASNGFTVITHPVPNNSELPYKPPRTSSLANQRPREEGPPSYDSYLRRKSSKRKRVNFAIDGVTVGESVTDEPDQLRNDMPYPLHASCDDMRNQFKPQPKPLRSSLKKTQKQYGPILHSDEYNVTSGRQFPPRRSIDSDHSIASVIV